MAVLFQGDVAGAGEHRTIYCVGADDVVATVAEPQKRAAYRGHACTSK